MGFNEDKKARFTQTRQQHWDAVSGWKQKHRRPFNSYQKLLHHHYRFLIPEGSKVLELGCGHGHLLHALKPSKGVGVDFSPAMIEQAETLYPDLEFVCGDVHNLKIQGTFDAIVISDLLNDLWDAQQALKTIRRYCNPETRIIINTYSRVWQPFLGLASKLKLATPNLQQNWFTKEDILNLLHIEGFELIKRSCEILFPVSVPLLSPFCNRFLAKFAPFRWFTLSNFLTARVVPKTRKEKPGVSVIVAARNEEGNIPTIIERIPKMGSELEIIFVEGGSSDNTYAAIEEQIKNNPDKNIRLYRQTGVGKGDAVRLGFDQASQEILMILDADMTVAPEDLPRFYEALAEGKGEFINGVRLIYPMEKQAMRFFNLLGNKFFSMAFSWILGQSIKDTLCGTKVLTKTNYRKIADNRSYFGDFDPFGDFDLIFGAAKQNLKIVDMPVRYGERTYGETNISRWKHGMLLLRMAIFAANRMKFI